MKRTGSTTRSSLRTAAAVLLAAAAVALVSLSAGSCAVARKPQPPSLPQPSSQPSPMPGPAPVTTTTTIITATTTTTVGTPVPALPDKAAAAERKYAPFFAADSRLVALGAKREPLSSGDMVRASLIMSGASSSALPGYESRLASLLRTVADGSSGAKTEGARAEAALTKLHTLVFRSYSEYASSITGVLDTGVYNCLSSALFYHFALRTMGIESKGVETVDHAFCLVRADGREIDVETTTVYGFDPGTKKEFTDVFSKKSGYTYVPPGDYARRKTIGDKAFLGLLASNFVAEAEKKAPSETSDPEGALRTATEALKHALDGYAIRNDAEGRALLDGRIGNFVVVLFAAKRWDDAAGFVAAAEKALGADAATSSLRVKAGYNLSISLNERSDEEGALRAAAWARIPQAANAS
ncbi:MAG: hypothetical protein WBH97_00235, partial [Rectinemataceae bacterium]